MPALPSGFVGTGEPEGTIRRLPGLPHASDGFIAGARRRRSVESRDSASRERRRASRERRRASRERRRASRERRRASRERRWAGRQRRWAGRERWARRKQRRRGDEPFQAAERITIRPGGRRHDEGRDKSRRSGANGNAVEPDGRAPAGGGDGGSWSLQRPRGWPRAAGKPRPGRPAAVHATATHAAGAKPTIADRAAAGRSGRRGRSAGDVARRNERPAR
jgi:hypothetical protein